VLSHYLKYIQTLRTQTKRKVTTGNLLGISKVKVKEKVTISAKESKSHVFLLRVKKFPKRILINPNFVKSVDATATSPRNVVPPVTWLTCT
jgi:hypothetical protein